MQITKQEMEAIISLAKKIIEHQSEEKWNKQIRQSEDKYDNMDVDARDYLGPEKCESCND
jgi:hypothetical protein